MFMRVCLFVHISWFLTISVHIYLSIVRMYVCMS